MTDLIINNNNIKDILFNLTKAKKLFDNLDISDDTRKDYQYRVKKFIDFINENGLHRNSYLDYKKYLKKENMSVSSKNKYLIVFRIYLNELNRQGYIKSNICQNIKSFKQTKKHKRDGLNGGELKALAAEIKELGNSKKEKRVKAFFCLLYLQGFRQVEIIRLNVNNMDLKNGIAMIQGKGQDDREPVKLLPETVRALKGYIKIANVRDGALFQGIGNRKSERIGIRVIENTFKQLFNKLGIDKVVHGFRHAYTTELIKYFKDLSIVRKFTRHRSYDMLITYDDELLTEKNFNDVRTCFKGVTV